MIKRLATWNWAELLLEFSLEACYLLQMKTITDKKLEQLLAADQIEPISSDHREWMNAQIKLTLEKKAQGKSKYVSLDAARKKFGLDAS